MKLVRCKVCGLILPEGKIGDRCPACGVPKANFLPYVDPVGESRRRILMFRLHPIAVHFPVGFSVSVLVLAIASFIFTGEAVSVITSAAKVLAVVLPLVVIIAALLGLLDGKIRYRKIKNSLFLKRKLALATAFFAFSVPTAILVWQNTVPVRIVTIVLAAGCLGCAIALGLIGDVLDDTALPGK